VALQFGMGVKLTHTGAGGGTVSPGRAGMTARVAARALLAVTLLTLRLKEAIARDPWPTT